MGQAKKRGSFEQRRLESIARREDEIRKADEAADRAEAEKKRKFQEWWASLTPEQQQEEKDKARKNRSAAWNSAAFLSMAMMFVACAPQRNRRIF